MLTVNGITRDSKKPNTIIPIDDMVSLNLNGDKSIEIQFYDEKYTLKEILIEFLEK